MGDEKLLEIEVVTPQKRIFSGKITSVIVPGSKSPFQILYRHAPIVSSLDPGVVRIVDSIGKELFFAVSSGFVAVQNNSVSIFVGKAFTPEEIDPKEIKLKIPQIKAEYKKTKSELEKASLRLAVAELEACLKTIELSQQ